jgi:hypothetical protein
MANTKLKVKKNRVGAPNKKEADKKHPSGLTMSMYQRSLDEAKGQGIERAELERRVWEWYFTALDSQRGDVNTVEELFGTFVQQSEKNHKGDK